MSFLQRHICCAVREKCAELVENAIVLHKDMADTVKNIFWHFGWELLQHSPYSSSVSPPDNDWITKLKHGNQFVNREEIFTAVWHKAAQISMSEDASVIHHFSHHWQ
jgi:hypothetical protein